MKAIKTLLLGLLFTAALVGSTHAQKLQFPTNVRYIAGGYIAKRPYFPTLETALNDVKALATSSNPYIFWVEGDSLWIADWDSVFTASGLTMKDSIDVYYVAAGKIKWGGFMSSSSGGGTGTTIPEPDDSTYYYKWPAWDTTNTATPTSIRDLSRTLWRADAEVNRLIVYTHNPLGITNDTLGIDFDVLIDSLADHGLTSTGGLSIDSTRLIRVDINGTMGATYTLTGTLQATSNGQFRLGVHHDGSTSRVLWYVDSLMFSPAGTDTETVATRNWVRTIFGSNVTSDTSHFSGTNTSCDVTVTGGLSSDQYVVSPLLADSSTAANSADILYVIPYNGGFYVKRGAGGTSELKFCWIRKPD